MLAEIRPSQLHGAITSGLETLHESLRSSLKRRKQALKVENNLKSMRNQRSRSTLPVVHDDQIAQHLPMRRLGDVELITPIGTSGHMQIRHSDHLKSSRFDP